MSIITTRDVAYAAALAKIAITEQEAEKLAAELETILAFVRQLDAVDTQGLSPTYQVTGHDPADTRMRKDEHDTYGVNSGDLLKNVPHTRDGYIEVPKVL